MRDRNSGCETLLGSAGPGCVNNEVTWNEIVRDRNPGCGTPPRSGDTRKTVANGELGSEGNGLGLKENISLRKRNRNGKLKYRRRVVLCDSATLEPEGWRTQATQACKATKIPARLTDGEVSRIITKRNKMVLPQGSTLHKEAITNWFKKKEEITTEKSAPGKRKSDRKIGIIKNFSFKKQKNVSMGTKHKVGKSGTRVQKITKYFESVQKRVEVGVTVEQTKNGLIGSGMGRAVLGTSGGWGTLVVGGGREVPSTMRGWGQLMGSLKRN